MKGISTIIATIVLLLITIALAGTAYMFFSGVFTGKTAKIISLLDSNGNTLIIRNDGTNTISSDELKIVVNGQDATILNPQNIEPGEVLILNFIPPEFGFVDVTVMGPTNALAYTADITPHEFRVTDGTVGLWHFDSVDDNGYTLDSSGNGNDGILAGENTFGVIQENPSSVDDGSNRFQALEIDSNYIYAGGYDSTPGNYQWRIEKRDINTGALVAEFGTGGVIQENPSSNNDELRGLTIDNNYIYVVGYDRNMGNSDAQWRIEKRDINTGALVTEFDGDGILTNNPTVGAHDYAYNVHVDSSYMYLIGFDSVAEPYQWRIEKRDKTTGALITEFDMDGIVQSNPNSQPGSDSDWPYASAIDSNYLYVGGRDTSGENTWPQWRVEKRDLTTGALVSTFGSGGVVQEDIPNGYEELFSLAIDSNYIYLAGYDKYSGNGRIRVEKRDLTTGALVSTFGSGGVVTNDVSTGWEYVMNILVDSSYIYISGVDSVPGYRQWRYEKRDKVTGDLVSSFDDDGIVTNNIDSSYYGPENMVKDDNYLYAFGVDNVLGNLQWRFEKINIINGVLGDDPQGRIVSGMFNNALIFDGVDDYIRVADSDTLDFPSQFTILVWIKTGAGGGRVVSKRDGSSPWFSFEIHDPTGEIQWETSGDDFIGSVVQDDTWHFIAVTRDANNNIFLYTDGILDTTGTDTNIYTTSDDIQIGVWGDNYNPFDGLIDEVKILNKALTQEEILNEIYG